MTSKKSPKILVLGAAYETGNMGVDALLSGTIASALEADPETEVSLLDYGREPKFFEVPNADREKLEVDLINLRFSWRLHLPNNGFRLLALAALSRVIPGDILVRNNPWLGKISSANWAFALAGGDSFSDIYGMRRLLYVCLPQFLVSLLGVKLVLLPQTVGPFKSTFARLMGKWSMDSSTQVFARDQTSLKLADDLIHPSRPRPILSQDMAFALTPETPENGFPELKKWKDGSRPLVGLNVSGLLYKGGYTGDNMFGLEGDYPGMVEGLVRLFVNELSCNVILVSHVTGAGENDGEACQKIAEKLQDELTEGGVLVANQDYNHRQIKALIGHCEFFLGARMHACIAALSQGIPAAGLAYSRKFLGVYETIKAEDLVVDLRSLSNEEVFQKAEALFKGREQLAATMATPVVEAQSAAKGLLRRLFTGQVGQNKREENSLPDPAMSATQ